MFDKIIEHIHCTEQFKPVWTWQSVAKRSWSKKLDKTSDEYELIWLSYEIGRCHLELGQSSEALKHGRRALELSEKLDDQAWQLNINVLLGQAYLLLQRKAEAVEAFRVAQQLAKVGFDLHFTENNVDWHVSVIPRLS